MSGSYRGGFGQDNAVSEQETVVITGSSGRIGAALAERLSGRYRVVGLDRRPAACAAAAEECFTLDLCDEERLREALAHVTERHGPDLAAVVHLAAYYSFSEEEDPKYDEVNVRGTERLLHALRGLRVRQFLFASTMLVHRPCEPGERIDEEWPLDHEAAWGYPRSKLEAEMLIRRERGEIRAVNARLAAVYDEWCRLIPLARQMQRIYERRLTGHFFPGDEARGMAYLHLEDAVEALARIVDRREALPEETALLIGEEGAVPYGELQDRLGSLLHGHEWETVRIPPAVARAGSWLQNRLPAGEEPFIKPWMIERADYHYALDTSRARDLLDWTPRRNLREGLPELTRRLREFPLRWYEENDLQPPAWLERRAA